MGATGCCITENRFEVNTQLTLKNELQSDRNNEKSDEGTNDEKNNNKLYSTPNIDKNNYDKIKINLKNSLKNQMEFISDKEFEEIIEQTNKDINKIDFPNEIENNKEQNIFIAPPVKFINGEIYKGSWNTNNQRHGFGININPNGLIYKGLWEQGNIGKYGLFLEENGNYFKGELKNQKFEGKGEMEIKGKYKYVGDFSDDLPNGKGTLEDYEKGFKYDGDMINGIKEGKGILKYTDGTIYNGDFKSDLFNGYGVLKFKDGKHYEGEFVDGKVKGKGKFIWEDGKIYEGEYDNFMKNGNGKFFWNDNKYYDGQWVNNRQHGKGLIYCDGQEIEGIFRFGKIIKGN
jgi:hypothetical protein